VILRAPAFIYPATVWGLRPPGSFIGRTADDVDVYMPEFFNYQIESSGRRVRWFEMLGPGTITRRDEAALGFPGCYQWNWDTGTYQERDVNLEVYSYAGLRKPSFISFYLNLRCESGATSWKILPGDAEVATDALVYPFGTSGRVLRREETMAYTLNWDASLSELVTLFTAAVGTWGQIQFQRFGTVGALSRFKINLVTERQCRAYVETIDNLGGTPVFSFSGSGQTFPVSVRGPSDTDLAVSAGGTTFNGGSPEFYLLAGRSSIGSVTTARMRFDFEVPYDI